MNGRIKLMKNDIITIIIIIADLNPCPSLLQMSHKKITAPTAAGNDNKKCDKWYKVNTCEYETGRGAMNGNMYPYLYAWAAVSVSVSESVHFLSTAFEWFIWSAAAFSCCSSCVAFVRISALFFAVYLLFFFCFFGFPTPSMGVSLFLWP